MARSALLPSIAAWAIALGACAGQGNAPPDVPKPVASVVKPTKRPGVPRVLPKLPEWMHYDAVPIAISGGAPPVPSPLTEAQLGRPFGAEARWKKLPLAAREFVRNTGLAVVSPREPRTRIGAFYTNLRDEQVPYVITLDALFFLTHLGLDRALADAEAHLLMPAIDVILRRLDTRLNAASKDAKADLIGAFTAARGIVSVAATLASPSYAPAAGLADLVRREKALVLAHAGPSESPLLGVPIDYSRFAVRGMAARDDVRSGHLRALAYLAEAPLMLMGRGEEGVGGRVSVSTARTHTRAALLMCHLLDAEVDAESAKAWERIDRYLTLLAGPSDDVTPVEMSKAATSAGANMRDAQWIANVVKLDRVRHIVGSKNAPKSFDGAGGVRVEGGALAFSLSMRLFGGRSTPDGEAMQALVFPLVGAAQGEPAPSTARDGKRARSTALDIAAWLGSSDARSALRETKDDSFEGYDAALKKARDKWPNEEDPARHASLYASGLDAIGTYLATSAGDNAQLAGVSTLARRRRVDVALAAWTMLRHDAVAFARLGPPQKTAAPARPSPRSATAFVEPHPEAIAKLLAWTRQTKNALLAIDALDKTSPSIAVLDEVDAILTSALAAAVRATNDESLTAEEVASLAAFPDRVAALDTELSATGAVDVPLAIDVHTDVGAGTAVEQTTGALDEIYVAAIEPRTRRVVLAVGASIPHLEIVQGSATRLDDITWRGRLAQGKAPRMRARPYAWAPPEASR